MKDENLKAISLVLDKNILEALQEECYNISQIVRKLMRERYDEFGNKKELNPKKSKKPINTKNTEMKDFFEEKTTEIIKGLNREYNFKKKVKANTIEITFDENDYKQLVEMKGNRTWKELIIDLSLLRVKTF